MRYTGWCMQNKLKIYDFLKSVFFCKYLRNKSLHLDEILDIDSCNSSELPQYIWNYLKHIGPTREFQLSCKLASLELKCGSTQSNLFSICIDIVQDSTLKFPSWTHMFQMISFLTHPVLT